MDDSRRHDDGLEGMVGSGLYLESELRDVGREGSLL
jgi:hypothetical protein